MWNGIFHETGEAKDISTTCLTMLIDLGWLVTTCGGVDATEHLKQSYANLTKNNQTSGIEFVETREDLIRYVPQLKHARDISSWKGLWNKQAGWAHAHDALKKLADEVNNP